MPLKQFGEYLTEMSNLTPADTGLKNIVWLLPRTNKEKHGPRLKVSVDGNLIPVSISDNPRIMIKTNIRVPNFTMLQKWIVMNKALLLKFWEMEGALSMRIVLDNIKKV